jgi:hypothetical protein
MNLAVMFIPGHYLGENREEFRGGDDLNGKEIAIFRGQQPQTVLLPGMEHITGCAEGNAFPAVGDDFHGEGGKILQRPGHKLARATQLARQFFCLHLPTLSVLGLGAG